MPPFPAVFIAVEYKVSIQGEHALVHHRGSANCRPVYSKLRQLDFRKRMIGQQVSPDRRQDLVFRVFVEHGNRTSEDDLLWVEHVCKRGDTAAQVVRPIS